VGLLNSDLADLCRIDIKALAERERAASTAALIAADGAAPAAAVSSPTSTSAGASAGAEKKAAPPAPTKEQREAFVKTALKWSSQSGAGASGSLSPFSFLFFL
jgi:hypothetical protein